MEIVHKIINANMKTNIARFINHSCNPNCILDVRAIMGKKHLCFFCWQENKEGD